MFVPAWLRFNDYAIYLKSQNFKRILLYIYHHNVIQSLFCCLLASCTDNSFSRYTYVLCIFHDYCMNYIKYCRRRKLDMVKYRRNNKKISNEMIWYTRRDDLQILVEEEAERNIHYCLRYDVFQTRDFPVCLS